MTKPPLALLPLFIVFGVVVAGCLTEHTEDPPGHAAGQRAAGDVRDSWLGHSHFLSDTDVLLTINNTADVPRKLQITLDRISLLQPAGVYALRHYVGGTLVDGYGKGADGWGRPIIGIRHEGENISAGPPPDDVYRLFYELPEDDQAAFSLVPGPQHVLISLNHVAAHVSAHEVDGAARGHVVVEGMEQDPDFHRHLFSNNDDDWDEITEVYTAWGGAFVGSDVEPIRHGHNDVVIIPGADAQGRIRITDSTGVVCERGPVVVVHGGWFARLPAGDVQVAVEIVAPPWSPVNPVSVWMIITDLPIPPADVPERLCFA